MLTYHIIIYNAMNTDSAQIRPFSGLMNTDMSVFMSTYARIRA